MSAGQSVAELRERFAVPGALAFEAGPGGLLRAVITTPAAEAHVYLQGAHVSHYQPTGADPVLFLSARSRFASGQPIRGGVPLCFPWFAARAGDPAAPAHGFARTAEWSCAAAERDGGEVRLAFQLEPSAVTRRWWPHDFVLRYRIRVGESLDLALDVENRSASAFTFEAALHTYLAVADVREASLSGLADVSYLDKTDGMARKRESPGPLRLTGETDRVYLGTEATCVVEDPPAGRRLVVAKGGSTTTVVWNPWAAKARAAPDLGEDEWLRMLCVETANAHDDAVTLAPAARHTLSAAIRSEAR
jgi:glucose-6-phosphate 1-epimerase